MVYIKHNVPSLKNGRISTDRGSFHSKTVQKYLRLHGIKYYSSGRKVVETYKTVPMTFPVEELKELFKDVQWPVIVGFHIVRDSKRRFDFINSLQVILDMMTAFDIIPDDNMDYVIPQCLWLDGKHYSIDKENAGVYIEIIKN